jgi:hypothetical protein
VPLPRALSAVRHTWVLVVMVAALAVYLWADRSFGDDLVAHYQSATAAGGSSGRVDTYREAAASTGLAALLIVALPAAHVVTRALLRRGADRRVVRLYAGGVALVDLLLGLTLVPAATLAAVVLATGLEGIEPGATAPFGADAPWPVVAVLLPMGLVGVWLAVRSCWRLGRVVFGRPVATPPIMLPPR